jgi:C4-dicarboxylate transporter
MKKFIQSKFWQILGGIIGAVAGYIYWKEIGCSTGTCPITSKPLNSVVYFGVLGYFVAGTIAGFVNLKSGEHRA